MIQSVLADFGITSEPVKIVTFGSGLINNTWQVTTKSQVYILQRVNDAIFKNPEDIAFNISLIDHFLQQQHPEYMFTSPLTSCEGSTLVNKKDLGYFRMYPFVKGSFSRDVIETPAMAYEASTQFGRFTKMLSGLDISRFRITIPCFHDLSVRYQQFQTALANGNEARIRETADLIKKIRDWSAIAAEYEKIKLNPGFRLRVTHHDTKINNVLFDKDDKAICVIDLDTIMPGYFISDVGDMMRTYLSPVSEEETDFSKIVIREEFYKAVVQGYYNEMKGELTPVEKQYFFYAGTFMIYMQAVRFLTDYLNDDIYYGSGYPGQNRVRAQNQTVLLERLLEKKAVLENLVPVS